MRGAVLASVLVVGPALAGEPPVEPLLRLDAGVHAAVVNQAAVTRDGRILTVSDDKTARLWAPGAGPGAVIRVPVGSGSEGALYAVATSPAKDSAVVAGRTAIEWDAAGAVYAVDLTTGKLTGRVAGLPGTVHALAYSQDGRFLAIGTGGRASLRVLDLTDRTVAAEDAQYADTAVAAAFLPGGQLLTASLDGKVRLYDTRFALSATHALPVGRRPWRLAVSPQGDRVAVGSLDAAVVTVLSTRELKVVAELRGEPGRPGSLSAVVWTRTGVFAAGTYGDSAGSKRVRAWNDAGKSPREGVIALDTVTDLVALPDGGVAFTTAEPSVGVLDPKSLTTRGWPRSFADFRDAFKGTFAASADGTVVDFGMAQGGRSPVRFDLNERSLVRSPPRRTDLTRPLAPTAVRGWRNEARPTLNGVPIPLDQNEMARAVAAPADGRTVLLGADYSLRLLTGGRLAWVVPLHAAAWAVQLTRNGQYALAALGDGTLRWYRSTDGAEVLALFATADGRWIAWTPEGYFDHSPGAEGLVGYHVNHGKAGTPEFVRSAQIYRDFYRPDLLTLKVKGTDVPQETAKTGDARTVVAKRVPPDLRLLAWCVRGQCTETAVAGAARGAATPSIVVDDPTVTLRVGVEDRGSGVGHVVVKRNAAAIPTRAVTVAKQSGGRVEEHIVMLEPGENLVTVTAYDSNQSVETGTPLQIVVRYAGAPETAPDLHVVSIGVNRYRSAQIGELVNATKDARAIADLASQARQGLFRKAHLTVLLDEQATLLNIRQAFKRVAETANPNDVVLVFLAGHGVIEDGRYSFLPYDTPGVSSQALRTGALTQEAVADLLSSLPTSRAAVLIDTCHAGAVATPDAVLRQARDRSWVGALGHNTGRFILAGTTTQQEALDGIAGHGVFTTVLLDGLRGQADQAARGNRDGRVDVVELTRYSEVRVPEEAKKIAPTHAQRAVGFFAGTDFFELSANTDR